MNRMGIVSQCLRYKIPVASAGTKYPSSNPLESPEQSAGGGSDWHFEVALHVLVLASSLANNELM